MIFGPEIIGKILAELEKVPNVRYVCNKIGVDHSTFYRWMGRYAEFHKAVELALYIGREKMNGAAESVIVNGIQNNDYRSATYWLSHNDERYIGVERVRYFQYLEKNRLQFQYKREEGDPLVEAIYNHFWMLEQTLEPDIARQEMAILASAFCHQEPETIKRFKDDYLRWKQKKEGSETEDSDKSEEE